MNNELMLTYLSFSYFDEDYTVRGLSPTDLVGQFSATEGLQYVQLFYVELAEELARGLEEESARALWMDEAGSHYDPKIDGIDYLEWLRTVLFTVGAVLRQRWLTPRDSLTY